jgi:hypothetical protein
MISRSETLKRWANDNNLRIVINTPDAWGIDTKEYGKKKLYAYSYFDSEKNCWINPTRIFQYINDMHYHMKREILDRRKEND